MKNLALTTLAVVTLTIFAGDARAQGGFFSSLFGLSPRPVSSTSYYGTTYPATNSSYYGTTYPAANCNTGICTTPQYPQSPNNGGYYPASTGNYSSTYPSNYGSVNYSNWNTQSVVPASYSNCPNGYCPQTPVTQPTLYNTTPYSQGHYTTPAYNTPAYNNGPSYNNAPYYNNY